MSWAMCWPVPSLGAPSPPPRILERCWSVSWARLSTRPALRTRAASSLSSIGVTWTTVPARVSVKRVKLHKAEEPVDWFSDKAQSLYELRDTLEFKTTWHPIGA